MKKNKVIERVFGDLIAIELMEIQPMKVPSGLIFDYMYGSFNDELLKAFDKNECLDCGGKLELVFAPPMVGFDYWRISMVKCKKCDWVLEENTAAYQPPLERKI